MKKLLGLFVLFAVLFSAFVPMNVASAAGGVSVKIVGADKYTALAGDTARVTVFVFNETPATIGTKLVVVKFNKLSVSGQPTVMDGNTALLLEFSETEDAYTYSFRLGRLLPGEGKTLAFTQHFTKNLYKGWNVKAGTDQDETLAMASVKILPVKYVLRVPGAKVRYGNVPFEMTLWAVNKSAVVVENFVSWVTLDTKYLGKDFTNEAYSVVADGDSRTIQRVSQDGTKIKFRWETAIPAGKASRIVFKVFSGNQLGNLPVMTVENADTTDTFVGKVLHVTGKPGFSAKAKLIGPDGGKPQLGMTATLSLQIQSGKLAILELADISTDCPLDRRFLYFGSPQDVTYWGDKIEVLLVDMPIDPDTKVITCQMTGKIKATYLSTGETVEKDFKTSFEILP